MSQHDHLPKRLCGSSGETLERARELLHTVTVKTAPGTGFQLKDPAGRPAACALIALEQLKNTVVDPTSAQGSSCLNPAAFRNCLAQVRAALAHDISHTHTHKPDAHAPPERNFKNYADRVARWCQRAEFTYFNLGKGNNIARASPKIKLGIFFWVCKVLEYFSGWRNNHSHMLWSFWIESSGMLRILFWRRALSYVDIAQSKASPATKNGSNFSGAGLSKATTSCAVLGGLRP
ncbi:hypothetical protein F5880DRAFT_1674209 [Lentinula raphanica]|nr:hypothetical protein F5880DRAFT_1674209 [Lentinula raphanica]